MTIHIHLEDIKCSKCSALFIPFEKNFRCPNCNEPTDEFFDFISEMIYSLEYHKQKYGKCRPDAWYVGSLAEYIQSIIFDIFDSLEIEKPNEPEKFINDYLEKVEWNGQVYLKDHIKNITLATLREYGKMNNDTKQRIGLDVNTIKRKIRIWPTFLP